MHSITLGNNRTNIFSNVFGTPSSASNTKEEDDNFLEVEGKVKTRLLSMWNNMKYGMKLKTNFSKESPVWLLGRCYHKKLENTDSTEEGTDVAAYASQGNLSTNEDEGFEGFKSDFMSRIWMTYRREFPILNGSNYSSDCGWGCMLRSGQMLLAQALVCYIMGRSWRWNPNRITETSESYCEDLLHRQIVKWFGDRPCRNSPFSIHELVKLGESSGKKAGDWYGPGFVAHLLRQAVKAASKDNIKLDKISVYVAQDCAVYIDDVLEECKDETTGESKSVVILIPVRLGNEKFNPVYGPCLTALFSLEQCIGVIGGRPKHSLYFVGYQDDKLIHLDPHYCQDMVDVDAHNFPFASFHCRSPRKMNLSKMDPSCCIGFYCAGKSDFFSLKERYESLVLPSRASSNTEYPMFVFAEGHGTDAHEIPEYYRQSDIEYYPDDSDANLESEEFVMLQ